MRLPELDMEARTPVYQQLVDHVKREIAQGQLRAGMALPSRRELATRLGITVNTVQRALRSLEEEGVIETPHKAASIVRVGVGDARELRDALEQALVEELIARAQAQGLERETLIERIRTQWRDDDDDAGS